jgi:hypothetical protein
MCKIPKHRIKRSLNPWGSAGDKSTEEQKGWHGFPTMPFTYFTFFP